MTFASGTCTVAEAVALYDACIKLEIALGQIKQGDNVPLKPGRFTAAQVDALVTACSAAITAANA